LKSITAKLFGSLRDRHAPEMKWLALQVDRSRATIAGYRARSGQSAGDFIVRFPDRCESATCTRDHTGRFRVQREPRRAFARCADPFGSWIAVMAAVWAVTRSRACVGAPAIDPVCWPERTRPCGSTPKIFVRSTQPPWTEVLGSDLDDGNNDQVERAV
jgi:hypothetical protein